MAIDHEFKRAIEAVKLRVPLEDLVRERLPELKKSGNRFWACCPFHEEDTPSFSVEPRLGLWYCFGACSTGGDQIAFLQRIDNLSFADAIEVLAARAGVELPRRKRRLPGPGEDRELAVLGRVEAFFKQELRSREGRAAFDYLRERGLTENTIEAFGLGYAPAGGQALARRGERASGAEGEGLPLATLEKLGLVRATQEGRRYDFFRGRLTIPIKDLEGRTVGFGARRLADGGEPSSQNGPSPDGPSQGGPKYVNSSETPTFRKKSLIYGLDRALASVRRGGRLVLVEGYTDVMAAHQAGLDYVAAVLGTSTTEEHAALVRRAGTRHVSLVFDGDEAGKNAAWKALHQLLPLSIEVDVAILPAGQDPCDLLTAGGSEAFLAQLEHAADWFEFASSSLTGLRGADLARGVDRVLELLTRIAKPVHRESLVVDLASRLDLPLESLREQWRGLPARRRLAHRSEREPGPAAGAPRTSPEPQKRPLDPRVLQAYKGLVGAVLLDPGLVPRVRPLAKDCPDEGIAAVLGAVLELYEDEEAEIDVASVLTALGDHPARDRVAALVAHARAAEDPQILLDGELMFLRTRAIESEKDQLANRVRELEQAGPESEVALTEALGRLAELHRTAPRPQVTDNPTPPPTSSTDRPVVSEIRS